MIIELVGLPASGKSTLARALERELGLVRISIPGRIPLFRYGITAVFRFPRLTIATKWRMVSEWNNMRLFYSKFMNNILHRYGRYVLADKKNGGIIDEGAYQNVISLFESKKTADEIENFVRLCPRVDLLVFVQAPRQIRETRFRERGYGIRDGIMPVEQRADWTERAEAHEKLLKEAVQKLNLPHIVIDGTRSPNDNVKVLKSYLAEQMGETSKK